MSELCYIITENYPDDVFYIEHEYKHSEFELAKKDFIEFSKEVKQENLRWSNGNEEDKIENEDYYLVECDKEKLKTYVQSSDSILERIEEIILDQVETDEVFSKEDKEKVIEILNKALNEIKELPSLQIEFYSPVLIPKKERIDENKNLKCWVYDFQKQEIVLA